MRAVRGIARRYRDRIGTHYVLRLTWRFSLHIVIHPTMWAGSLYVLRRRLWLRPIDYIAIANRQVT